MDVAREVERGGVGVEVAQACREVGGRQRLVQGTGHERFVETLGRVGHWGIVANPAGGPRAWRPMGLLDKVATSLGELR